jgi:HAD superfamily hydrolase (TIGR01509 family)
MPSGPDWPAVLWDMDGTLVDTEPYWIACELELVAAYGGTWSLEHAHQLIGNALPESGEYIRKHGGVPLTGEQIVEHLLDGVAARVREHIPWRPGAQAMLASLADHGVPCALVTMSYRRLADAILTGLPPGTFATVVAGDDVTRGKPHPEPYLMAAALLGLAPADCVAIEDSPTGVVRGRGRRADAGVVHLLPLAPAGHLVTTLRGSPRLISDVGHVMCASPGERLLGCGFITIRPVSAWGPGVRELRQSNMHKQQVSVWYGLGQSEPRRKSRPWGASSRTILRPGRDSERKNRVSGGPTRQTVGAASAPRREDSST